MVHSDEAYQNAVKASQILFSGTTEVFQSLDEATLLDIMDGVKTFSFSLSTIRRRSGSNFLFKRNRYFPFKRRSRGIGGKWRSEY